MAICWAKSVPLHNMTLSSFFTQSSGGIGNTLPQILSLKPESKANRLYNKIEVFINAGKINGTHTRRDFFKLYRLALDCDHV